MSSVTISSRYVGKSSMSDNPEETSYYLRIISLFIDVATETVLKAFQYHIPEQNTAQFLSSSDTRQKVSKLLKDKVITKVQYNFVSAYNPNAEKFDISLLITLLINTDLLPPPQKGWGNRPSKSDLSLSADLLRLRDIRNSIVAHKRTAALYKEKFERLWEELEDILIRVNNEVGPGTSEELEQKIKFYRSRSLDGHDESKYSQKLEELWENCEEVSRLQEKVEELVKKCNEFTLFFKETPEKYSRYVRLMFEGGRLVLYELLNKGLSEQGLDLRTVLFSKRDVLESSIVKKN
ncbi:E3 ubiquitin-protein ligase DZIP3-like [Mercenaria mercenaria]|uniref:E3 ubiquitin-protein ligase DZIP3-like n=1 Tax=Mercenaria mercenaria TaxID=6596 RepID=UPI00234E85BB|nr:E3 ubiquitin-protein ligase DZIP3-like [Mercenaria mercenaria]